MELFLFHPLTICSLSYSLPLPQIKIMYLINLARHKSIILLVFFYAGNLLAQNWTQVASMPNNSQRYNAVSFSIGNKGYVTTGQTTSATLNTTFEYNPDTDAWTQMANFPGGNRRVAAGFAIGTKGYVMCGRDDSTGTGVLHNDVWEFDPATNTWTQKANFPGGNRESLVAFSIDGNGYAGLGLNGSRKLDFYKYDPIADTWIALPDINYYAHHYNTEVFVLNGKGYFATGTAYSNVTFSDYTSNKVFMFDPATGNWTQKNNFGGGARQYSTAFTVNGKAYMGLGYTGAFLQDLWQYDEAADSWSQTGDFTPGARLYTSSFTLGNTVYVGNGRSASSQSLASFYSWQPALSTNENTSNPFEVISSRDRIVISSGFLTKYNVKIFTADGKAVFSKDFPNGSHQNTIDYQLNAGVYILNIMDHDHVFTRKIVVP
jgi:N-acetylneuraminic acid mutarotase